eukprot:TRINITY_DN13674_c0_g2_i2.p2 TRINITY_DN13674_c0_g2~~TRINITY_DN13674_c0_g2_i2.p2  ORF type:complete len:122 (-),score=18.32 TRINITY_DN13674_c0_g2_i2:20-385(-)
MVPDDPPHYLVVPKDHHRLGHDPSLPERMPQKRMGAVCPRSALVLPVSSTALLEMHGPRLMQLPPRSLQLVPLQPGGYSCLLYTSDAADEEDSVDLGGRRIIKKKKKEKKQVQQDNKRESR